MANPLIPQDDFLNPRNKLNPVLQNKFTENNAYRPNPVQPKGYQVNQANPSITPKANLAPKLDEFSTYDKQAFNSARNAAKSRVDAARSAVNTAQPTQPFVNDTTTQAVAPKGRIGKAFEAISNPAGLAPQIASEVLNDPRVAQGRDDAIKGLIQKAGFNRTLGQLWNGNQAQAAEVQPQPSLAPQTKPVQGNIVGNINVPDSTINPAFQQRTLAPETYQNSTVDGIIPAKNQATQKPVQSSRRSLAPTGDNTGVFMGDFKIAKGQDANGKTNWEQQPQRVLTVNNEFQDMSDPVSQAALAQSDANFSRSAPRYNAGGQGGSGGVGPVTQVYRGSERTDYAFDGNGDPYVVPQKNSDTDLKMKNDQANQGLASQKAQRDYEMDQKRLGLEERRLNASLQPKPVSPEYAPVYDEIADSMGGTTKRLSGGYDKTTGQFKPVDNGGKVKDFQSLFSKYQKALEAGMPKEQADAELLRLMGN
jgi:hypothetical protein